MHNVKLILVLIALGGGLIVVGVGRMDMSGQAGQFTAPASLTASWIAGLIGVALVAAGLFLLRRGYLEARAHRARNPPQTTLSLTQAALFVAGALAAVALMAFLLR